MWKTLDLKRGDKELIVTGDNGLWLAFDYDDVDQGQVMRFARWLVDHLNSIEIPPEAIEHSKFEE